MAKQVRDEGTNALATHLTVLGWRARAAARAAEDEAEEVGAF
jgi:hypothetical protein